MKLHCQNSKICSACQWIDLDLEDQRQKKKQHFLSKLKDHNLFDLADVQVDAPIYQEIRDRVDLTWENGKIGFYQKSELGLGIFDLSFCPLMTPRLNELFQLIRSYPWPMKKASFGLRVSFDGQQGLWLDLSHVDTKNLLEEQTILTDLLNKNIHIEIGQRRKTLIQGSDRLRLADPEFHPWTRTWLKAASSSEMTPIPLQGLVGGFSQAGDQINQVIVTNIHRLLEGMPDHQWLEFGCGNGNLTLPLSQYGSVLAFDNNPLSIEALHSSLDKLVQVDPSFEMKIEAHHKDLRLKTFQVPASVNGLLVNPARNGVGSLFDSIENQIESVIYMSCYPESFFQDVEKLAKQGFKLQKAVLVDQFPHTHHYEILSLFRYHLPI